MRKTGFGFAMLCSIISCISAWSQPTFPQNGIADPRHGYYAFTHATILKDGVTALNDATLIIKDGRVVAAGTALEVPAGAVAIDCKGKYIYPSFIDIYTDYGTPQAQQTAGGFNFFNQPIQTETITKGPFGWNQAIKSETDVYKVFSANETNAKLLR